jgi:hypothetical protein
MYFGERSSFWQGGVAFYDPDKNRTAIMRLYKITWAQLLQIQKQETRNSDWYSNLVSLGKDEDGDWIYTFTSPRRKPENPPSDKYLTIIRDALLNECHMHSKAVDHYLGLS